MEMYSICVLFVIASAVAVGNSVPVESLSDDLESKPIDLNTEDGGEHVSVLRLNKAEKATDVRGRKGASAVIEMLEDSISNLQDRAVCPWSYSISTDVDRRPADLIVATCTRATVTGTRRRCEHIYHEVPVMTKSTSPDGSVTWVDDWAITSVGCTLV